MCERDIEGVKVKESASNLERIKERVRVSKIEEGSACEK